jgi:hypothetical protein
MDQRSRTLRGEPISSTFVESTVHQVISKHLVQEQAMRRPTRGAHLLLPSRTRVLDEQLSHDLRR